MAIGNPITLTSNVASKTINVIATASQSLFTVAGGYRINEIAVFRNGVRLVDGRDFTARDGSTVTLLSAATEGDALEFQIFDTFRVADAITPFDSDQTIAGNLNITGILSASQLGSVNFNVTSGIQTFNDVRVGGALTVAGVLTFDDVTNVDSVGYATFRSGINVQGAGSTTTTLNVTGVSTFGSIAAPTLTGDVSIADKIIHTGDTNTAIRFPAADTFTVETAGSERLRVSSAGLVGIGTDDPVRKLHLHEDSSNNCLIQFTNTTTGYTSGDGSVIGLDGDESLLISNKESGGMFFHTSNTSRAYFSSGGTFALVGGGSVASPAVSLNGSAGSNSMILDASGRLLLGTSSSVGPDNFLQLVGDVNDEAAITCWRSSDDAGSGGFNFIKTRGSVSSPGVTSNGDSLGILRWHAHDGSTWDGRAAQIEAKVDGGVASGDTPGRLMFSTAADGASSPTERLRITSAGKIGINDTSPERAVDIRADNVMVQLEGTGGNGRQYSLCSTDDTTGASVGPAGQFVIYDDTSGVNRLNIDSSGHVLIGPTASGGNGATLQVASSDAHKVQFHRGIASSGGPNINISKSRNTAYGSNTIVQSDDSLGAIRFLGDDGTNLDSSAARILCQVDGTPGENDMPGRLTFETTSDGASSPTERVRITKDGIIQIGGNDTNIGSQLLQIQGNSDAKSDVIICRSGAAADQTATLTFAPANNITGGRIQCHAEEDFSTGANRTARLMFFTRKDGSLTERMRITSDGLFKFSNTGAFGSIDAGAHGFRQGTSGNWALEAVHAATSGNVFGIHSQFPSYAPNNTSSWLYLGSDSSVNRFIVYSNGGIANYQTNNVNLCDEREKKNITSLDNKWDKVKSWELKKFHYNDQDDSEDLRYGVIAQQVEEHCPEVLTEWDKGEGVTRKGVREQQMMWMAIKALQEAQTRIETLETQNADLLARVTALEG